MRGRLVLGDLESSSLGGGMGKRVVVSCEQPTLSEGLRDISTAVVIVMKQRFVRRRLDSIVYDDSFLYDLGIFLNIWNNIEPYCINNVITLS